LLKKIVAILLLSVHLYSLSGSLIVHQYLSYCAEKLFNEQAAKGLYNTKDLEEVAVPVNLPGIKDWVNYENISGQIRFGENAYNYVQMKVTQHVLFLKCVPNYKATRLIEQNVLDAQPTKNSPVSQKEHVPYVGIMHMHILAANFVNPVFDPPVTRVNAHYTTYHQPEADCHIMMPKQPPRPVC
jgi:hypothetical protein